VRFIAARATGEYKKNKKKKKKKKKRKELKERDTTCDKI
jgi:hypothetical protein